jgi:hypothetical protein
MAVDRLVPTTPPSNTTFAYAQGQLQEEMTAIWAGVTLPLTLTSTTPNALTAVAVPALTAYADTRRFTLVVNDANTGNMTLSVDGLPALPLVTPMNTQMVAGQVASGQMLDVVYDSTISAFRVLGGLLPGATLPNPTQQWQVLQADASLNWVPSQQLFSGAF